MAELPLLRALALTGLFVSVLLVIGYVAYLDALAPTRKGLRGLARVRALGRQPLFLMVDPLIRWTARRVQSLVPAPTLYKLDRTLSRAGEPLGLEPTELIALSVLGAGVGWGLGDLSARLIGGSTMLAVAGMVLVAVHPWVTVDALMSERSLSVSRSLPGAVDLLCLGLSAGLDFPAALQQVVDKSGNKESPLVQELSIALQELSLGKTRREALEGFLDRNPSISVREFVSAIIQAEEEGQPLGDVLNIQATVSRQRRTTQAEEAASKAALQLLLPLGLMFVAVLLLIAGPMFLELGERLGDVS